MLAKALLIHPEEHLPWLVECCKSLKLSKTLFLLVLLQSFTLLETGNLMAGLMLWCFHSIPVFSILVLGQAFLDALYVLIFDLE